MSKNISLILMGCGGVGRQLLRHIVSCRSLHAKQGIHLRVVGVSDSKSLLVASDAFTMELPDDFLLEVCRAKSNGASLSTLSGYGEFQVFTNLESTKKIVDVAAFLGKSTGLALVDCSASSNTIPVLTQAVDLDCCLVMANKKPLTSTMEDYAKLVSHPRHIRHESTIVSLTRTRSISTSDANSTRVFFRDNPAYVDPDPGHSIQAVYERFFDEPWTETSDSDPDDPDELTKTEINRRPKQPPA